VKTLAAIVASGAVTSIGLRSIDTAFSHRAAAAGMRASPLLDPEGELVTLCVVPVLDPRLVGASRAAELGAMALAEVIEALGPAARGMRARLVIAADEHLARKGEDGNTPAALLAALLTERARPLFPGLTVEIIPRGAAAPGYALPALATVLAAGEIDLVILGGVHTDYDPARILELAEAGRLYTSARLDALLPGEAAAFVALMRPDLARRVGLPVRAEINAVATGHERARPDNDEPAFTAAGLTAALHALLGPLEGEGILAGWVLTDLTFETFRHFELQAAMTRAQRHFCEPQRVECPAQRLGFMGAAAIPLALALAAEAFPRGFAPHPIAVALAGSDGGERAALLLSAPR
jgi:3-oxoacyl-[acyl-carrier-protein] synthase I